MIPRLLSGFPGGGELGGVGGSVGVGGSGGVGGTSFSGHGDFSPPSMEWTDLLPNDSISISLHPALIDGPLRCSDRPEPP